MAQIISVVNQKGGVGKTTTSVNLATALALKDRKTLLIDADPQGNASKAFSFDPEKPKLYDLLSSRSSPIETLQPVEMDNLYLISSDNDLFGFDPDLSHQTEWPFVLKETLSNFADQFDYIILDSPPSLGRITVNILVASQSFIVPVQCEYYALEGLSQLLRSVERVRENYHPSLRFDGILLTMFDQRNRLSHQVAKDVRQFFKEQVFQTVVPRNVRLSEAPSFGKSIFQYDPKSLGAKKYFEFGEEIDRFLNPITVKINPYERPPVTG